MFVLECFALGSLLVAPLARSAQGGDAASVRASDELYPFAKVEEVVRIVVVKTDEPSPGDLALALKELGASVVYGPRTTSARPGRAVFALRAPWSVPTRELVRAARKAGGAADELACTAFVGREGRDQAIDVGGLGFTSRDFVMGISGEIVWFDSVGDRSQFYGAPGKIDAKELAKRYIKLYEPFGGGSLGRVVEERFTWTLKSAPESNQGAKLLKAAARLPGIVAVTLEGAALHVHVRLEDVSALLPAGTLSQGTGEGEAFDGAGLAAPRAAWCTRPLWDLLEAEGLTP